MNKPFLSVIFGRIRLEIIMSIQLEDTICAIATPPGVGAISVIRVSGKESIEICDKIFTGKHKLVNVKSHTIHYGKIVDRSETVDDVLVSVFKEPNSYTGENSVEISTHGSILVQKKIIELLLESGCRLADPGEFTRRAFVNGRLDLSQAEAVVDLINSRSEASLRGARNQLDGILSQKVDSLREDLVNISSLLELELDFAEEDLEFVSKNEIAEKIENTISEIDSLLKTYSFGRVVRDGVNVALVGKPNVGKSSLLNYILKESRAIVSPIPGTTRDVLREEAIIDGILFKFYDTAGIRLTDDEIEKEGVLRSRETVKNADLIILISDATQGFDEELFTELKNITSGDRIILIMNKIDLSETEEKMMQISAKTGQGIDDLLNTLKEKALGSENYSEKSAIVSNVRHYDALKKAKENLEHAIESLNMNMTGEFLSVDLRNAESALGEIIGKVTTDDILNNIFAKFCIGK